MVTKHLPQGLIEKERDPLADHCGIIASFAEEDMPFFSVGLRGLSTLQTRGYDGAGVWALDSHNVSREHKGMGTVNEVFFGKIVSDLEKIRAKLWVYQVRYGTQGNFEPGNVQPLSRIHAESGEVFVVAHNGQFARELNTLTKDKSDTVTFAEQLAQSQGRTWDDRIQTTLAAKKGAWSLVIGTREALYICRDAYGFRPLVYGHLVNGITKSYAWVVASETAALTAMGVEDFYELVPGTLAKITSVGLKIIAKNRLWPKALCIFENVYLQRGISRALLPRVSPRSIQSSPTVDAIRTRCGTILAEEAPLTTKVDMVIGVPGTGIVGGKSFARTLGLPYVQAIADQASSDEEKRTFMTAKINTIYQKVLNHFHFDKEMLLGKRVVLVDDSIVRGNISKGLVYLLKHYYQVTAVHIRVLSPAIDKSCHLGINTRSTKELIAAQCDGDVEKIRALLGAESIAYLSSPGLRTAITGDPYARGFCMGCMAGNQPPIDDFGKPLVKYKRHVKPGARPAVNNHPLLPI